MVLTDRRQEFLLRPYGHPYSRNDSEGTFDLFHQLCHPRRCAIKPHVALEQAMTGNEDTFR